MRSATRATQKARGERVSGSHTLSIQEASNLANLSRDRLRTYMNAGVLKGYISPNRKIFKPTLFSLLHDVLGYPGEFALKAVFEHLGPPEHTDSPPRLTTSSRRGFGSQRRQSRGASSSLRTNGDPQNGCAGSPLSLPPASTSRRGAAGATSPKRELIHRETVKALQQAEEEYRRGT